MTTICPLSTPFPSPQKLMHLEYAAEESEKVISYSNPEPYTAPPSYNHNDFVQQQFEETRISSSYGGPISCSRQQTNNQQSGNTQHFLNVLREFWLWECAGWFFSLMCLISIICLLTYEDGRQLEQWPLAISPNAVVAFIATLAKGALVMVLSRILSQLKWLNFEDNRCLNQLKSFDLASRGPLGSFMLLWTSKRFLAFITALLMLFTFLVDPFIQIVFSFPSEAIADPTQKSTFSNSSIFDPFGGKAPSRIADSIVVSVHNGLNGGTLTESFNCPSGFCKWPEEIKTLGVCGFCSNVTKEIHKHHEEDGIDQGIRKITYAYKFPSGQFVYATGYPGKEKQSTNDSACVESTSFPSTLWNSTIIRNTKTKHINSKFINSNDSLVAFQVLRMPPMDSSAVNLPPAQGYECGLYWCEKTFHNVTAAGGHLNYTPTFATLRYVQKSKNRTSFDYLALPDQVSEHYNSESPSRFLYKVRDNNQLHDYLAKNVTSFSFGGTMVPQGLLQPPQSQLVESQDITATIVKLSESLTEMIRTSHNRTKVLGHTMIKVPFFRVQWGWLALPLALLFATGVLLAVVASKSYSSRIAVWKDDPLALLFHRVDGIDQSLLSSKTHITPMDIENLAGKTVVRLSDSLTFTRSDVKGDRSSAISLF